MTRRLLLLANAFWLVVLTALPANAATHALIQGTGSSWSSIAVQQWISDVEPTGMRVVYTGTGSATGRKDFAFRTTDYAVSDIGFQGTDPVTGEADTSQGRAYAYLPIVAGGTAFPYQIKVAGKLVRNLRLSGETLTKIFTNRITNWNDPQVTRDNNGRVLPSIPIVPVVHSEGSGSTAQLTRYFAKRYPQLWKDYSGLTTLTEYYPRQGSQVAQNGSDGVINFITSKAANGAIGYDEYSYALAENYPAAKIQNTAGYYTLPTQYNVAVALTQAQINLDKSSPDYLLQNLDRVYGYGDVRTYPLSSYSYLIEPTAADDQRMTTAKRQTIADFLYYSICQGQAEIGPIGYSSLPVNLVQAGFDQIAKLKQADPAVDLTKRDVSTCHNPTFVAGAPKRNYLAEVAPKPPACDKTGAGPCVETTGTKAGSTSSGGATTGTNGAAPGVVAGSRGTTGTRAGTGTATPGGAGTTTVDPATGQVVGTGTASAGGDAAEAVGMPTVLPAAQSAARPVFAVLAALELLLALTLPPVLARRLRRRSAA